MKKTKKKLEQYAKVNQTERKIQMEKVKNAYTNIIKTDGSKNTALIHEVQKNASSKK